MTKESLEKLKADLASAGIEIYQQHADRLVIAERIRVHIMDSGVSLQLEPLKVKLSLRAQLSDFPNDASEEQFGRVRASEIASQLSEHGFKETGTMRRPILDPVDESKVLDVWFEVAYEKSTEVDQVVQDLSWCLPLEKCLSA